MPRPTLAAIALLVVAGCTSPTAELEKEVGSLGPSVTGIRVTSPQGPNQVTTWGTPTSSNPTLPSSGGPGQIPEARDGTAFYNPYPNPSNGRVTVSFDMRTSGAARVRVVRTMTLAGTSLDAVRSGGVAIDASSMVIVKTLVDAKLEAGEHRIEWDGTDASGAPVASGFYRVYLQRAGLEAWHDILLYRSVDELPADLRAIVESW